MVEQFGKVLAFQYQKILVSLETKQEKIKDHLEGNKNTAASAFERILEILDEAIEKFDFSLALA